MMKKCTAIAVPSAAYGLPFIVSPSVDVIAAAGTQCPLSCALPTRRWRVSARASSVISRTGPTIVTNDLDEIYRGPYMITATPTRHTDAPMMSKRSGWNPSSATPHASDPATKMPP